MREERPIVDEKMKTLPNRKSPRANWHDYNNAEYFVTICTKDRVHYFGEVHDGNMRLTAVGEYLRKEIENTNDIRGSEVNIPLYVIMPNHVHLIVIIHDCRDALNASAKEKSDARGASLQRFGPQSRNLGSVIRGIKSAVTHLANEKQISFAWQTRYHDHIIRSQEEMNNIAEYIEHNPAKWETDCFFNE